MAEVRLEIPARPEYLALARQVVAAAAALEPRFRDERIDDLRVAVSEATTNAIKAYAHLDGDQRIVIACNLGEDRIEVEVRDEGGGFDVESVAAAPSPDSPDRLDWEHGLGIPLMRELTDETEIRATGSGTAVRLVVYSARPSGPASAPSA